MITAALLTWGSGTLVWLLSLVTFANGADYVAHFTDAMNQIGTLAGSLSVWIDFPFVMGAAMAVLTLWLLFLLIRALGRVGKVL